MTNVKKVNFIKADITVDEEIQFAGDKKDSETSKLTAESILCLLYTSDAADE